jgi:hypothetical protein
MMQLHGYSVVLNDSTYPEPNRTVARKDWHRGRVYQRRVQKKWIKRFGTHPELVMAPGQIIVSEATGNMVMNSATWQATKAALSDTATLPKRREW